MCRYEFYSGVDTNYSGVDKSDSGVDTFQWVYTRKAAEMSNTVVYFSQFYLAIINYRIVSELLN